MIRQIAAIDSQRGIATDSGIPWKLPGDSAYFREKTSTGLIVMGRATYDEFAAPLHGEENYVLTTTTAPLRTGFQAITGLEQLGGAHPDEDIWVIGGATVYRETIAQAEELLLTQVLKDFACTKFFPPYESAFVRSSESVDQHEAGLTYRFEVWSESRADCSLSVISQRADRCRNTLLSVSLVSYGRRLTELAAQQPDRPAITCGETQPDSIGARVVGQSPGAATWRRGAPVKAT